MQDAVKRHLTSVQRLGKAERIELRSQLKSDADKSVFTQQIALLVDRFDHESPADLEDMFIFGAQIADVWPGEEMILQLHSLNEAACAFFHGFSGYSLSDAFEAGAMSRLEKARIADDSANTDSKRDAPPKKSAPLRKPSGKPYPATVQLHRQAA